MNIFDLDVKEINKKMKEILSQTTPEKVLSDLFECGYRRIDIDEIENETKKINYKIEEKFNIDKEYFNFIKLHKNRISYNFIKIFLIKPKTNNENIEMGDAA